MSDGAKLTTVSNHIADQIARMLDRKTGMQAFLNTVVYRCYQNAQRKRWMTENQSQGSTWKPLNESYRKYKLVAFRNFPGSGRKKLIATGRLQKSVIGPGTDGHRKVTTTHSLTILTSVPYAGYVDQVRNFSTFSEAFRNEVTTRCKDFLIKGKR